MNDITNYCRSPTLVFAGWNCLASIIFGAWHARWKQTVGLLRLLGWLQSLEPRQPREQGRPCACVLNKWVSCISKGEMWNFEVGNSKGEMWNFEVGNSKGEMWDFEGRNMKGENSKGEMWDFEERNLKIRSLQCTIGMALTGHRTWTPTPTCSLVPSSQRALFAKCWPTNTAKINPRASVLGLAYAHALAFCPASARHGGHSLASLVPESSKSHAKTEPSRALATLSFCENGDLSRRLPLVQILKGDQGAF